MNITKDAIEYINSSFFLDTKIKKNISDLLPFQIQQDADLSIVEIDGNEFIFLACEKLKILESNNFLHVKRLASKLTHPLVIVTKEFSEELAFLARSITGGLIIPGSYSLLPSLLIHRKNEKITLVRDHTSIDKPFGIIPSYLICYYLSGYFDNGIISSDIIDILEISKMSVSRAAKELLASGIIEERSYGRNKEYHFVVSRKDFWHFHRHRIAMLSTNLIPVDKDRLDQSQLFMCAESALAKYSYLSPPRVPNYGICLSNEERYMRTITPATIDGDYFFKIKNIPNKDNHHYYSNDHYDAMLQIFPFKPLIINGIIDKLFLLFTRFYKNDLRVNASFNEIENEIFDLLKN
ncbi:hypothetical protein AB6880_00070 [Rahnella inusitata]|uniref:hypothetical protein n=1 Tax=Rahnella inusitata TaxID=58169 RepID=UPI0039BE3468